MTRVAVVEKVNEELQVVEIINWDRSYDLKRPAANRLVDVSARADIQVGWTFNKGVFSPPKAA
jgi:hypothetical protein